MTLWQMITANVALITAYVHLVYILMHPYCCLKPVPTVTDMSLCDFTNCQLSIWKFLWCYRYMNMLLTQLANICRECQVYTGSLWLALQGNTNGNAQLMLFPIAHNLVKIRSNPDSLNLQIFGFNMNCYLSLTITPSKYTS